MLARSLSLFFKNASLPAHVLSCLIFDYYFLFLPVLLYNHFQENYQIALVYGVIYGLAALVLKSKNAVRHLKLYSGLIGLSSLVALFHPSLYGAMLVLCAFLGLTVRDSQLSSFHTSISDLSAEAGSINTDRVFSIMLLLGMALIPIFTLGANIILSFMTQGSETAALWAQLGLSLLLIASLHIDRRVDPASRQTKISIPPRVRIITWYSCLYNATSFPVRMIVTPLIIYAAIREMGYDQDSISITGAIIGFVALPGILIRFLMPSKTINNVSMMVTYHRLGILIMMTTLTMAYGIHSDWWSVPALPWVIAVVVTLQLSLEITAKLWSLGFTGLLRHLTVDAGEGPGVYQASYLHFMTMKNLGSFLGFILAAGSYLFFPVPFTVFLTGAMAIGLVVVTIDKTWPQRQWVPA